MLRLFYLLLSAAVMFAPCGCAGAAWWLADDGDVDLERARNSTPRAGASPASDTEQRTADAKQKPSDAGPLSRASGATRSRDDLSIPQAPAGKIAAKSPRSSLASPADSQTDAADPLADQVRSLAFDDPAEEASALAALRAAPPAHRAFLLRTMQASAAVRKQNEARAKIPLPSAASQDPRYSKASKNALSGANRIESPESVPAGRGLASTASPQQLSPRDGHPTPRRPEPIVDANAVAVIEVEPAAELPNVVRPAGYNGPSSSTEAAPASASQDRGLMGSTADTFDAWQRHLHSAIAALEADLQGANSAQRPALEARLRLIYLAADRRDEALRSKPGTSMNEQEFWSKEIYGLATMLDIAKHPELHERASVAAPHLRGAAEQLAQIGGLSVKNLHFCTEVKGYGSFVSFSQDEFRPGQEVLLYCEVENFQSKLTEKGYHTALKARYQVFDAGGNRVAEKELGLKDEHCQNRRRDFFVPYFLWTPKQVPAGKYQLKLTLEDVHAGQTAESTIEFRIKDK